MTGRKRTRCFREEAERELLRGFQLQKEFYPEGKAVSRTRPLVSIIVITYNHGQYISQCLDSLLEQKTTFPYEIIIGDDGSSDGTSDICRDYAAKYQDRIRLFVRDRKLSHSRICDRYKVRFNGIWSRMSAEGAYIAICEGDDFWTDANKLEKQISRMEADFSISLTCHEILTLNESSGLTRPFFEVIPPERTNLAFLAKRNFIPTQSVVYRKSAESGFDIGLLRSPVGDYPLFMVLAELGDVLFIPEVMAVYRSHEKSLWSSRSKYDRHIMWLEVLAVLMEHYGDSTQASQELLEQTVSTLQIMLSLSPHKFRSLIGSLRKLREYRNRYFLICCKLTSRIILKAIKFRTLRAQFRKIIKSGSENGY